MGKLTDLQIYVLFDDQNISFKTPVSVTKEGVFTTTLPKEIVDKLLEYDATPKLSIYANVCDILPSKDMEHP